MKLFEYDTKEQAQTALDQVNAAQDFTIKKRGKTKHIDNAKINTNKPYTVLIETDNGWGFVADDFTRSVISGKSEIEFTPKQPEI